jgi:hypothetical protein
VLRPEVRKHVFSQGKGGASKAWEVQKEVVWVLQILLGQSGKASLRKCAGSIILGDGREFNSFIREKQLPVR